MPYIERGRKRMWQVRVCVVKANDLYDVRFTPESGHCERMSLMSAFDPKRTFAIANISVLK